MSDIYLCFQRNARLEFEECHIPGQNNFLNPHFYSVPILPLGHSCPLQTLLLSDLVGCDRPLQIVMVFWCTVIVSRGLSHPTQKV
jgi:hypothetical protein